MTVETDLRTCDECGDAVAALFSLGRAERCYDCHLDARDRQAEQAAERDWLDQF